LGAGGRGVSERVAVTAASLARELNVRLDNAVSGGVGISISQNLVELPGGDPTDPSDDVLSYTVSAGLPGNTDTVGFAGLTLGALQAQGAQPVTSIVNAVSKTATTAVRQLRLVTEEGLFTSQWIRAAQVEDNTLTLGKIQTINDFRVLGRSNAGGSGNVQQVTVLTSIGSSPTDAALVTEKGLFTPGWITNTQVENNTLALGKIQTINDFRVLGRSNAGGSGNVQQITVGTSIGESPSNSRLLTEKAVSDAVGAVAASVHTFGVKGWMRFDQNGLINNRGGVLENATCSGLVWDNIQPNGINGVMYTVTIPDGDITGVNSNQMVVLVSYQDSEGDHVIGISNVTTTEIKIKSLDLEDLPDGPSDEEESGFSRNTVHLMVMY
jgi:hypothetical protein